MHLIDLGIIPRVARVSADLGETMAVQYDHLQSVRPVITSPTRKTTIAVSAQEVATPDTLSYETEDLLKISPYTEREHLLDLNSLDAENAILAQALVHLECLRADYATAPYIDTFNWAEVIEQVKRLARQKGHSWKGRSFFIVAFRSQIPPTTVYEDLGTLDRAAHIEATASGGFLKYWFGSPDKDGKNLATCVWRSQEDAKKGGVGPAHRRAAAAARDLYSHWKIDRHRLIIRDEVESWEITDWA